MQQCSTVHFPCLPFKTFFFFFFLRSPALEGEVCGLETSRLLEVSELSGKDPVFDRLSVLAIISLVISVSEYWLIVGLVHLYFDYVFPGLVVAAHCFSNSILYNSPFSLRNNIILRNSVWCHNNNRKWEAK